MQLYNDFRSSASYRVRIAMNLKGLPFDYKAIHLVRNGGEQRSDAFLALNPDGLVPVFIDDTRDPPVKLTQSLAFIAYLDALHPEPPLLTREALERARVRALAMNIACEIHPVCHGETPTLADLALVPQVFNARRFDCDLSSMPAVSRIVEVCQMLDALKDAVPSEQPDAE